MSKIYPTAVISPEARLADDVVVGAYAIVEGSVSVGAGTEIQAHAQLIGPLTMGARNRVHSGAVLGGWPQDRKFKGDFSETIIGDDNIFREHVTIHRGTGLNTKTIIGHRNYFMVASHVGHNSIVGNDVTLVNGAAMAGHTQIGDRAILGAYCTLHQFCRMGRLALSSNQSAMNVDLPPFCLTMATNNINQLNAVGLRRSGMSHSSINALRQMFQYAFREGRRRPMLAALMDLPAEVRSVPEVAEFIDFCRHAKRGIARFAPWSEHKGARAGGGGAEE